MKRFITITCVHYALSSWTSYAEQSDAARIAGDVETLVLTIDGIDPDMTGRGAVGAAKNLLKVLGGNPDGLNTDDITGRGESYLVEPINKKWDFVSQVESYPWKGDMMQTESDLWHLKAQIAAWAERSEQQGRAFVIVAHSWGSVLAYRAISELWGEGKLKRGSIRKLVTIGSPIRAQNPANRLAAEMYLNWAGVDAILEPAESWTNFWLERDNISGPIDGLDHNIELQYAFADPHNAYYRHPGLLNRIGEVVAADLASFSPAVVSSPTTTAATNNSVSGQYQSQPVSTPPQPSSTVVGSVNVVTGAAAATAVEQGVTSQSAGATTMQQFAPGPLPFDANQLINFQRALQANAPQATCNECLLGGVDMSAKDLTATSFPNLIAPCANFSKSTFSREDDQSARFGSTAAQSHFKGAYLVRANFGHSILKRTNFSGSILTGAQFVGADLEAANLARIQGTGANFSNANLVGVDFGGATLLGANFQGANLKDASLAGAYLRPEDLTGAVMCNTTMPSGDKEYGGCNGAAVPQTTFTAGDSQPKQVTVGFKYSPKAYSACGEQRSGLEITSVDWGGPTWALGLRKGDIIQHIEYADEYRLSKCDELGTQSQKDTCKSNVLSQNDRYKKPTCDQMYFVKVIGRRTTTVSEVPLVNPKLYPDNGGGQPVEFFVLRNNKLSVLPPITFDAAAPLRTSEVSCPAPIATLAAGRPSPPEKASAGNYRGATLESIVHGGDPAMKVLAVESGSDMEAAGVQVGDILRVLQPQHIRYGGIDTAEKLRLIEQEDYDRNPNNPQATFSVLVRRGKQQYWIHLPHREIPK